jgi:hypothetical protein
VKVRSRLFKALAALHQQMLTGVPCDDGAFTSRR